MSVAFDDGAGQLSSSASSSFISEEPMSDPRGIPSPLSTGTVHTPEPATGGSPASLPSGAGGPNVLNVNNVTAARSGAAEKPLNGSPAARGVSRFMDPKDENGFAPFARRTASGIGAAAGTHPSPTRVAGTSSSAGATATNTATTTSAAGTTGRATASSTGPAASSVAAATAAGASANGSSLVHPAVAEFAKHIAETFFKCAVCAKVATDAVMIGVQSSLVCRRCAVSLPGATPVELPRNVREGLRSVRATGGMPEANTDVIGERRILRAKRYGAAATADPRRGGGAGAAEGGDRGGSGGAATIMAAEAALFGDVAARMAVEGAKVSAAAAAAAPKPAAAAPTAATTMTSRQFKLEADRKYENAEYTAALELYTKSIALQPTDKLTNLKFLYGNRSAALYMAQRYDDCISDCLEVVRLEPTNTKMVSRAARAACTMGDLQRSVDILQAVPRERRSEENEADLNRYRASLETFRHAERCFGTTEGDEQYRMLVAQYSDTVPFRIRSAESLQKQKHFMRAVEVLEALSYSARTPKACRIMSECLYLSGFEHFDRAKKCLVEAAQLDDDCSALLRKIDAVDDGKQNGNMNFNKKNYGPAAEFYTAAIQAAADNEQVLRVLYCNRAAAYKELGRYREGVEDCTKTLTIDKEFFKAYARRARCHEHLGDHFASVRDYKKALEYDTTDRELARELRNAEQNLAKEAEREKDFYYQLGVTRSSTEREVKLKYRELSLRWHPDKCIGMEDIERERAEHKFKMISEAYATLVDPVKRREYDLKQDRERFTRPGGFASTYSGGSNEYFRGRHRSGGNGFW